MQKTVIVAGCARSGMTLTMNLLHSGGYPCFGLPPAFEDYEIGRINWQESAGKAVKLVDTQLQFPPSGDYVVILTKRDVFHQAKSTIKFMNELTGAGIPQAAAKKIAKSIEVDWYRVKKWAERQSGMIVLDFADTLKNPLDSLYKISSLIEFDLKPEATNIVYKRGPECYNGLLEKKLIQDHEATQSQLEK